MPKVRILDKNSEPEVIAAAKQLAGAEFGFFYFSNLESKPNQAEIIRLALLDESNTLQALSILKIPKNLTLIEIICFKAISDEAFEKYAETLFIALENKLKEKNCSVACMLYEHELQKPRAPISFFLEKQGFGSPTVTYLKYYFDCYAFKPKWFTRDMPLPQGFEIFPWKNITESQEKLLSEREDRFTYHPFISPFVERESQQEINSLGLKLNDQIIGWMVTHTLPYENEFVRYSAFYIEPEYQHQGLAIPLLKESIRLQQRSNIQWSYFTLNLQYTEKDWLKFCEKRLAPDTYKIVEVIRRCKAYR